MSLISLCPDRSYGSGGVFQTLTVPSKLAEAIHSPSGLNATQEHADVAAAVIRYRQIGDAVAVEIAHCHGMWSTVGGMVDSCSEGAVAVAQLPKLPDVVRRRQELAERLAEQLEGLPGIETPWVDERARVLSHHTPNAPCFSVARRRSLATG